VGVLSSWSLAQCEELDKIFATELRRRTKNMKFSQLKNLFQPASEGGQGYQRFSDIIKHRKRTSLNRVLPSADNWSRSAADALVRRCHRFPHYLSLPAITPQIDRLGHLVTMIAKPSSSLFLLNARVRPCISSWRDLLSPGTPDPPRT